MNKKSNNKEYSRKDFLRDLSLGMGAAMTFPAFAAGWTPQQMAEYYYQRWDMMAPLPENEKLGIALVGLGSYAGGQLAPALMNTKLCRLSGIVTGTPAKEGQWAEQYGIPESNIYNYETYDRIADNPDIDIIYVVLPNNMHAEYTIRGFEAGKHVISEKPLATSVADAEAMVAAARSAGKSLSVGYRLHFEPFNEEIMHLGQEQVHGPIESIDGRFAFNNTRNPDAWRLDKEMAGGGPLMDLGTYVIQAAIYAHGALPVAVTARSEVNNTEVFDEVEESIFWDLEFPDGVIAHGECSYSSGGNYINVTTADGEFGLQPAYSYNRLAGTVNDSQMDHPDINQQTLQMDAFSDHILNGAENRVPGEMGLRDVKLLYAIYEAAETGQRVELNL